MQAFLKFIHDGNFGDGASVLGVLISLIGFAITLDSLARSKRTAEKVAEAVKEVRQRLTLQNTAGDLETLMKDIQEIKSLHRLGAWDALPIRYTSIRHGLVLIKSAPMLTELQRASVQGIIEQFKTIDGIVEKALASGKPPKNVVLLNQIAADQSDKLTQLLISVKNWEIV